MTVIKLFLLAVVVLFASSACSSLRAHGSLDASESHDNALERGLPEILAASGAASISVAHIETGEIVAVRTVGLSGPGREATVDTQYNVASLSKPVSAEAILRLVSENRFSLDESMASAWVDPDVASDTRHLKLTPRIALIHQTGFPNWRDDSGLRFLGDPGTHTGYSGEGYEYVARFVEQVTGAGIDQHATRLIFQPIGMDSTAYTFATDAARHNVASSMTDGVWSAPVTRSKALASDDLVTTARDYASFLLSVMRRDAVTDAIASDRSRILADRLEETCSGIPAPTCPERAGFTLGWELFFIDGVRYYMHTGADDDGFSLAYWSPERRNGTVILTNTRAGHTAVLPVLDLMKSNPEFVSFLRAHASR